MRCPLLALWLVGSLALAQSSPEVESKLKRVYDHFNSAVKWSGGDCSFTLTLDRDGFVTSMIFERCAARQRALALNFVAEKMPIPADDRDGEILVSLRQAP